MGIVSDRFQLWLHKWVPDMKQWQKHTALCQAAHLATGDRFCILLLFLCYILQHNTSFKAKQLNFPPSSIVLLLLSRISVLTQSHLPNTWWLILLFCIVLPHWFHSWDFKEISAVVALQKPFSSYLEIDRSQCYTVPMCKLGRYKRHWISLQANKALKDPKASPHLSLKKPEANIWFWLHILNHMSSLLVLPSLSWQQNQLLTLLQITLRLL